MPGAETALPRGTYVREPDHGASGPPLAKPRDPSGRGAREVRSQLAVELARALLREEETRAPSSSTRRRVPGIVRSSQRDHLASK